MKHPVGWRTVMAVALMLSVSTPFVQAGAVNRTIDDQMGDEVTGRTPDYQPAAGWWYGPGCEPCAVKPDAGLAHGGTWHDATANGDEVKNITLTFTGTAVWVYGIVPNTQNITDTNMRVRFDLDNDVRFADEFLHLPDTSHNFEYNHELYSRKGLPNTKHTLVMTLVPGKEPAILLFDYAKYTFDDGTSSPSNSTSGSNPTSGPKSTSGPESRPSSPSATPSPQAGTSPNASSRQRAPIGGLIAGLAALATLLISL